MKFLVILSLIIASTYCVSVEEQLMRDLFDQWKINNGKTYSFYEDEYRFNIFTQNYVNILAMNEIDDSVTLALNQFADMSTEEFGALFTGTPASENTGDFRVFSVGDLPASVDWRTKGAVTAVKNQGQCGGCWAFSTTGALEGLYFINNSNLVSFSEQNLIDCVTADQGCDGGLMTDAFSYTLENGIDTEADYPFVGQTQSCNYDSSKAYHVNKGYFNVTPKDRDQLKAAIVDQPVSVAIQANQLVFQFYAGGVIKKFCGDKLDHGVLAVGYDTISGTEAFIVKNSWGASWGNEGYVYIATDPDANSGNGVCGILSSASAPTN